MIFRKEKYQVCFQDDTGALRSFLTDGVEMVSGGQDLLEVRMLRKNGEMVFLTDRDARTAIVKKEDGFVAEVCDFDGFDGLKITVQADVTENGVVYHVDIQNHTDAFVESYACPCVAVSENYRRKPGNGAIFWARAEGVMINDAARCPEEKIDRTDAASVNGGNYYPGFSNMQYMAYFENGAGLYFGIHDTRGMVKVFKPSRTDKGIRLNERILPCIAPGSCWKQDYPTLLRPISGDWQDAAEIYRDFLQNGDFPLPPRVRENPGMPEWIQSSPVVVIYPPRSVRGSRYMGPNEYFPYTNAVKYLEDLGEDIDSRIMAFLPYWEGTAPWAAPFSWPPFGGEELFADYIEAMHRKGYLVSLYCSGLHWTDRHYLVPEYDRTRYREKHGLTDKMCFLPDGTLKPGICETIRTGYTMCCACEETKQIAYGELGKILDAGVDYVQYFDQHMGGEGYPCYAGHHSHPACHGQWNTDEMMEIYRHMNEMIRQKAGREGAACGTEGAPGDFYCGEMRFNDNRWHLNFSLGVPVPAYSYVLHEYTSNFMGNQCSVDSIAARAENPDSLLHALAYSFAAGDALTLVLKSGGEIHYDWGMSWLQPGPRQKPVKTLVRNLNAMRKGAAKRFLIGGRMIKTPAFEQPGSYTMIRRDGSTIILDEVLSSAWEADGTRVQIFVNYRHRDIPIRLSGEIRAVVEKDGSERKNADKEIIVPALDCIMIRLR